MLKDVLTAIFSYIGTTTDYFVVLLLLFGKYSTKQDTKLVVLGAYLGNGLLVLTSIIIALVLQQVPEEWLLGLLGIIPIIIGVKGYFSKEDVGEEIEEKLKIIKPDAIIWNVLVITFSACGADNMALYIPYFTMLNLQILPIILVLFIIILTAVIVAAYKLVNVPIVKAFFDKQGDLVQLIVYVSLGLYVLVEAGTLQHLLLLIY